MIEQALGMVSIGRLYNHIMALEGIRHPLDSYAALIQAGEYIETRFKQYSLETERHQFSIEGFNQPFFNIIGYLDRKIKKQDSIPRVIVTSHYDTVFRSPGADDNASAIAVMLEIAQILKKLDYDHPTQFISFNLEEGSPLIQLKIREIGQRYNVFDQSFRHTSYIIKKYREQYFHKTFHSRSGKFFLDEEEWNEFQEVSTKELSKNELKFFEALNNQYREWNRTDLPTMGSNAYAMDAVKREMNIQGLLNLESIGYTSTKFHSQTLPAGMSLDSFETYNLDKDSMIGNFIAIVGNKTSSFLAQTFFRNAQHSMIKLPCVNLSVPLNYDQIRQIMPDLLRSDHGPFWKYGIPAIMLTDTANFRNPYYHTTADTIDTLDFVFLKRVCQAVLATILRFPS